MNPEVMKSLAEGILPSALELLPALFHALREGKRQEARDLAAEMSRRQLFELRQRARVGELKG